MIFGDLNRMPEKWLEQAFENFVANPTSENWIVLEDAMYIYQGVNRGGVITEEDRLNIFNTVPVPKWREELLKLTRN